MQQSEFDRISAALDRAEFALEQLRKTAEALRREIAAAKTPEEILALELQATELKQQLKSISDAVHAGNPTPHLRLVE